ncbi:hypothetical protein COHA_007473 [Chlorella ohadii]|uniref:SGNH hydrolase-type esterase domain-containing protein n=1 Tax=Chlorella ohadii TaxID=2649997 RepID=A0AAD5H3B6_9CHLO|nr:hypothetical protein COHA_007473 [Chlorella ohadii]
MSQQADGGQQAAALPRLPDFAREHMEAGWENRALEEQLRRQRDYLVAFLGDSITAQLGYGHPLIGKAQAALGGPVGVFGVPGDTVANLMWRLGNGGMPAAQAYVVQIGTNDVWMCERPEAVVQQIQQLVGYLQAHHPAAHVVLLGLFYMDERHNAAKAVNASLRAWVASASSPRLHYCTAGDDLSPDLFPDGIHPEDEAWQQVLDGLTPLLQRLLAAPSSQ